MYWEKFAHTPPVTAVMVSQHPVEIAAVGAGSSTVAAAVQNIAFILDCGIFISPSMDRGTDARTLIYDAKKNA